MNVKAVLLAAAIAVTFATAIDALSNRVAIDRAAAHETVQMVGTIIVWGQ